MRKRASAIMGAGNAQQQINTSGYPQYASQNNNQAGRAGFPDAVIEGG